jgi:hypothetical protein
MAYREDEAIKREVMKEDHRLSGPMRAGWESGDFCIVYAERNNFALDSIYWQKIDQQFFATMTCPIQDVSEERINLLELKRKNEMEKYVDLKVEQIKTSVLAWDPDDHTIELQTVRYVPSHLMQTRNKVTLFPVPAI